MRKVLLDVTKENLIDFHHELPVISGKPGERFQFEVDTWDSADIVKLTFGDFRSNSTRLNPGRMDPVRFQTPIMGVDGQTSWSVEKGGNRWTDDIELEKGAQGVGRRLLDYTLTMELQDGTCVSIDPPLDERGG